MTPADDLPPPIPWGQLKKKLPKFMHDSDTARNCLQWLWETAALAARAERDEYVKELEERNANQLFMVNEARQEREAAEARVRELSALTEVRWNIEKERDTLQARVAELEEKLMVMCVTQLREAGDARDTARLDWICQNGWLADMPRWPGLDYRKVIDAAIEQKQSRPSPDQPALASSIDHRGEDES